MDEAAWEDIEEYLTFMQPHKHLRVLDDGSKEEVEHWVNGRAAATYADPYADVC